MEPLIFNQSDYLIQGVDTKSHNDSADPEANGPGSTRFTIVGHTWIQQDQIQVEI